MSSLDPFQGRVRVFLAPESWDPAVISPDPTRKGPGPISEVHPSSAGSGAFHAVGPDPLRVSGARLFPSPRGDPRAADEARQRTVLHATRDFSAGPASSPCNKGTHVSRYRQWPPGPPQGRVRACRWGQNLYPA
jgi:hypothetical protein